MQRRWGGVAVFGYGWGSVGGTDGDAAAQTQLSQLSGHSLTDGFRGGDVGPLVFELVGLVGLVVLDQAGSCGDRSRRGDPQVLDDRTIKIIEGEGLGSVLGEREICMSGWINCQQCHGEVRAG